jgi:copper chaperone CopZ
MKIITLNVAGMSCEGCANSIRSALSQLEGVKVADISLTEKAAVDRVSAVEAGGYEATVVA